MARGRGNKTPVPSGMSKKQMKRKKPINESYLLDITPLTENQEIFFDQWEQGKNLFVAAHGNSLRSIIMHLEGLSKEEGLGLEVPTGAPMMYEMQNGEWKRTMG